MKHKNFEKTALKFLIFLIFIAIALSGCSGKDIKNVAEENSPDKPTEGKADLKMAWYATIPHPFMESVRTGVEAFERDYGIEVEKQVGKELAQSSETESLEELAAKGYRLFSVYPIDPGGANDLYEELAGKGCKVVSFGATTVEPTKASFYVGTDVKASAVTACERLIQSIGGKGNIINVLERLEDSNTELRKQGIEEVVKKYPDVKIIQQIAGINTVEEAVQKINASIFANSDDVDGIISTGDTTSIGLAQVLTEYRKTDRKKVIHSVGICTDPIVVNAVREGTMDETIAQNPYGMGYISCLLLKYLQDGWSSKTGKYTLIDTGFVIANKENIDHINDELIRMTNHIKDNLEKDYLTK